MGTYTIGPMQARPGKITLGAYARLERKLLELPRFEATVGLWCVGIAIMPDGTHKGSAI